jgi:hypothetical protein
MGDYYGHPLTNPSFKPMTFCGDRFFCKKKEECARTTTGRRTERSGVVNRIGEVTMVKTLVRWLKAANVDKTRYQNVSRE